MSHPISAVVFDLDGTLLDTREDLVRSINHIRDRHSLAPLAPEMAVASIGRGVEQLVAQVLDVDEEELPQEDLRLFREHYLEHCCDETVPYPGIPELLTELHQADIGIGVVTNKPQESAERLIAETGLAVAHILGANEDRPKKPDPAMLLEAIEILQAERRSTIFVGDLDVDLETARRADCAFVGVDFGFAPDSQLFLQTAVCVDNSVALRRALLERD